MNQLGCRLGRIIVVARPNLGRSIEIQLRGAGYEVHRTPGSQDLQALAKRLRPQLIIVALDLPWKVNLAALTELAADKRPIPIILLGDSVTDLPDESVLRLPLLVDGAQLQESVRDLLPECLVIAD